MKWSRWSAILIFALPWAIAEAEAQDASLSLNDAIARAVAGEPSLRAEQAGIAIALGEHRQASLRPNPTLTVERRDEPGGFDSTTAIGVEWPLDLFRRSARVESAERDVAVARLAAADRQRLLVAEVRLSYGAAAAARREVAIADELVASVAGQAALIRARVDEGAARPLDRDLLEVELARLRADRARAASRAEAAIVILKRQIGMDPDEPLELRDPLDALVDAVTAPGAAASAAAPPGARPDVEEAEARIAAAEARLDQARREGRFDVSVVGGYMRMHAAFPQSGVDADGRLARVQGRFNYLSAAAMVRVPLFDRNQGRVESAHGEQARARAARDATVLAAKSELAIARLVLDRAREALELYAGAARPLARQNLDVVRQTFTLGRASVFDVLNEQRRYLEFEIAHTQALRDVWDAHVVMTRAIGETK